MAYEVISLFTPNQGGNNTTSGNYLSLNHYSAGVNVVLDKGQLKTRFGCRDIPLQNSEEVLNCENGQGFKWFNPSRGQSSKVFAEDKSRIVAAVGGNKYDIKINGEGNNTTASVLNITNGYSSDKELHLVYWTVGENYAIAQDGFANAFIYDANSEAHLSTGYNTEDKNESRIPNGATVGFYAHGQLGFVSNQSQVIIGDRIHKNNLSNAENILEFTEQVHQYTGTYLSPASQMHGIMAANILPIRNTAHGHGEVLLHAPGGGVVSININPSKEKWDELELIRTVLVDTAAEGPYALDVYNGDQVFRSRIGVQTIRSAAADADQKGNNYFPISDPLKDLLDEDYQPYLRFASISAWGRQRRLLCTIKPVVSGRFRWHKGLISMNHAPIEGVESQAAWEGVHSLPYEYSRVVQLIRGHFGRMERQMAWAMSGDGKKNHLVEFEPGLKSDVLPNRSLRPIESQVQSVEIHSGKPLELKRYKGGKIFFDDICDEDFEWEVLYRTHRSKNFKSWSKGCVKSILDSDEECNLTGNHPKFIDAELGSINSEFSSYYIQILVKWKGHATLKGVKIRFEFDYNEEETFKPQKLQDCSKNEPKECAFDLFEYSRKIDE